MQDEFGTMDFRDVPRSKFQSYSELRIAHAVMCWVLGAISIAGSYQLLFPQFFGYFAVILIILAGAFFLSVFANILLHDFFSQLGYREKFAVFLIIGVVSFIPHATMRTYELETQMLVWLIATALLSFNTIGHGRYYLVSIVMFCFPILFRPLVMNALVLLFPITLVVVFWLDYVVYRLQEYGKDRQPDIPSLIKGVLPSVWIPFLVGFAAFFFANQYYQGDIRIPVFDPGIANNGNGLGLSLLNQLWIDAVIIIVTIVSLLLLLYYLEKKFRIKKKGELLTEELMDAVDEERFGLVEEDEEFLLRDQTINPSQRIILRFMQLTRGMEKKGYARYLGETGKEFMKRLADKLLTREDVDPQAHVLFNEACYSPHSMTEEQADQFTQIADEMQPEMEAEIHRLIEREVYLNKLRSEQKAREQSE